MGWGGGWAVEGHRSKTEQKHGHFYRLWESLNLAIELGWVFILKGNQCLLTAILEDTLQRSAFSKAINWSPVYSVLNIIKMSAVCIHATCLRVRCMQRNLFNNLVSFYYVAARAIFQQAKPFNVTRKYIPFRLDEAVLNYLQSQVELGFTTSI